MSTSVSTAFQWQVKNDIYLGTGKVVTSSISDWYAEPPISLNTPVKPKAPVKAPAPITVSAAGIDVTVTAAQLKQAIVALGLSKGAQVKAVLVQIGSPLADLDHLVVAAIEMKLNPALRKGPQKTKKAFLAHITKKLNQAGTTKQPLTGDCESPTLGYQALLDAGTPAHEWPKEARQQYLADHKLQGAWGGCCWHPWPRGCGEDSVLARKIAAHLAQEAAARKAAEGAIPRYRLADPQPDLPGYHRKHVLVDQHGTRWLFKPAPEGKRFRADTEHAAHLLARMWGYPTAESRLIEFDGMYGQAQRMFTEAGNLAGIAGTAFNDLTVSQLITIGREHLLDWAFDNDDAKGDNLIITDAGSVVGVDKARAWAYFGGWDGLSSHDSANSNAPLVYTELYRAIKDGQVDRAKADAVYLAVIAKARRMQRLPAAALAQVIGMAVAARPHYRPPSYREPCPGAPSCAGELIAAATARKDRLAADMQALWERVYDGAGWALPGLDAGTLGSNAQGHPMHAGLHDPALHAAVAESKSYGTPAFVAGADIEDAHILLWREKHKATFRVRGQWKTRGAAFGRLKAWCAQHAVRVVDRSPGEAPPAPPTLPGEASCYDVIINAAKTVSYHCEDGEYNAGKLQALATARATLAKVRELHQRHLDDGYLDGLHAAVVGYTTTYLGYIDIIEAHKAQKTKSKEGDFPRYTYTPEPVPAAEPQPAPAAVEFRRASRAAAVKGSKVALADDGELALEGSVLVDDDSRCWGQPGFMYLITLPTGEQVEFRADEDTETPLSTRGLTQFTIPDEATIAESLERITGQLATMGLDIEPADLDDLELYYWRHLAGVMADRADSRPGGHPASGGPQFPPYTLFWEKARTDPMPKGDEIEMWRGAFSAIRAREHIDAFIAAGGHLPRFMHMDLRNPELPCGKPYWERFDVPDEQIRDRQMPTLNYRSGPRWVVATGVCMATEARIRTFAIWKSGLSSTEDMNCGSAGFIFARQNQEAQDGHYPTVFFNPRVLKRTTNYAFDGDLYGRIENRKESAYFDHATTTGLYASSNELLIKDAVSLLDDIEILVFEEAKMRDDAIKHLANIGITEIRGLPVKARFVHRDDNGAVIAAKAAVRESLSDGTQPG